MQALVMKSVFLLAALLSVTATGANADPLWQDDLNWLKNTCYRLKAGEIEITHRVVNGS